LNGLVFDPWSLLALLALAILLLGGLWFLLPQWYGLPQRPARPKWIRRALELANVQPEETVYDLGSGDGRALVIAAREFHARAVGIEIEPVHCAAAWLWALFNGVTRQVSIRRGDLLQADLRDADVVFLYLTPAFVERVRPHLESQLRPGTRVVSLSFDFEGWQPANIDIGHLIFLYQMPPHPGSIESYMRSCFMPQA
jgi:SAM-dependent methyltransferase